VAAGDFNGDGFIDLATTIKANNDHPLDPERRGLIQVFYNTQGDPPYHIEPDREIRGPYNYVDWGTSTHDVWFPGVASCDYNGDGHHDLLAYAFFLDSTLESRGYKYYLLFLGGDSLSATPDAAFHPPARGDRNWQAYTARRYLGDINGDGCTDILLGGTYHDNWPQGSHYVLDVYFGNRAGRVTEPDFTTEYGFWKQNEHIGIADLNNDGCDEIIGAHSASYGNIPYCLGRPDIAGIQADDSLLNPVPDVLIRSNMVCPVGDVDGDGLRDVLVGWAPELFLTTTVYFAYPRGVGKVNRLPVGSFAVDLDIDNLLWGAWPVGDVNGDGYDDVIVTGQPPDIPGSRRIRFRIYGGSSRLVTVEDVPKLPERLSLTAYPNPAHAGETLQLFMTGIRAGRGSIVLRDMLGREMLRREVSVAARENSWQLPLQSHAPGVYTIEFHDGKRTLFRPIVIL
jgi:hypothetical protein